MSLRLARLENMVSNLKTTLTLQPRQIAFKYTNFSLKNIILAASLYHLFEYIRCLKKKKIRENDIVRDRYIVYEKLLIVIFNLHSIVIFCINLKLLDS